MDRKDESKKVECSICGEMIFAHRDNLLDGIKESVGKSMYLCDDCILNEE